MSGENRRLAATCTVCGSEFVQSGPSIRRIMDAYKTWDAEHQHAAPPPSLPVSSVLPVGQVNP